MTSLKRVLLLTTCILLVGLILVDVASSESVLRSLTGFFVRSDQSPASNAPLQEEVTDDTNISLVNTSVSQSHVVVEFVIQHPMFPNTLEEMANYHIVLGPAGEALTVEGFASAPDDLNTSTRREAGQIRLALELPPLAGEEQATITIEQLQLWVDIPEEQRAQIYDLAGPWGFTVTPQETTEATVRRFSLDLEQRRSDVRITIRGDMQLSETETLVPYRFSSLVGTVSLLKAPVLSVDGEQLRGRERNNMISQDSEEERENWLSFPPVPESMSEMSLTLGPFLLTRAAEQQIVLDVAQLESGGQIVQINDEQFRFVFADGSGPGLALTYMPLDETGSRIVLRGIGSGEPLEATDALGNSYTDAGGTFELTSDERPLIKSHTLEFAEPLSPDSEKITLISQFTGFVVDVVTFDIPLDS